MKHCIESCSSGHGNDRLLAPPRFPDLKGRYKVGWREALQALLGPAERLHKFRNMRSAMFYDAIERHERREDSGK